MGITLEFKQVSPYLLEKIKEYPDLIALFIDAKYLSDSPFWQELTINPDDEEDMERFNEMTNYFSETLEKLQKNRVNEYEQFKENIPRIISEGKLPYLDIDKKWRLFSFLLTGYDYTESVNIPILIGINEKDNMPLINAVLSGEGIKYYECDFPIFYLNPDEVQQIAKSLSKFPRSCITERLKLKDWQEADYILYHEDTYNLLVQYYCDAANNGNAIFLIFG